MHVFYGQEIVVHDGCGQSVHAGCKKWFVVGVARERVGVAKGFLKLHG